MSDLVPIAYPHRKQAEEVRRQGANGGQREESHQVKDAVIATRDCE